MKKFENIENVIARERSDCGNLKEQVVYAIIKNQCHSEAQPKNPSAAYDLLDSSHSFRMTMFPSLVARRFPRLRLGMTCPTLSQRLSSLLKMTFPVVAFAFAFVLSFAQIGETYAKKTCDCGTAGHETECCWEITEVTKDGKTEKVLTISPGVDENGNTYTNVQMKNYKYSSEQIPGGTIQYSSAPWATKTVTSVKVEGGINKIGSYAFCGEKIKTFYAPELKEIGYGAFLVASKLKDVYIPKVSFIDTNAFAYARALESIEMPSVEEIGYSTFNETNSLKSVDLPNLSRIGLNAFSSSGLEYIGFSTQKDSEGCLVNAKGERLKRGKNTCLTAINIVGKAFSGTKIPNCSADGSDCGSCGYTKETGHQYVKSGVGCVKHCGEGFVGKNGRCIEGGCGDGYVQVEDWCNRVRYTPAEAAPLLTDENNMVTITFRK